MIPLGEPQTVRSDSNYEEVEALKEHGYGADPVDDDTDCVPALQSVEVFNELFLRLFLTLLMSTQGDDLLLASTRLSFNIRCGVIQGSSALPSSELFTEVVTVFNK